MPRPIIGCHGFGVLDKAVSSWFDNVPEEHRLTEDGKTVAPVSWISIPKELRPTATQTSHHQAVLSCQDEPIISLFVFIVIILRIWRRCLNRSNGISVIGQTHHNPHLPLQIGQFSRL